MSVQPSIKSFDYSLFGDIEKKPLSKIRKLIAYNMTASWTHIPHVTHEDEADVSRIEQWRQQYNANASDKSETSGQPRSHLTILPIVLSAVIDALKVFPEFNASLNETGETLILKHYYHIGIAVDTEHGLLVPVVKNADRLSLEALSQTTVELAEKTRDGKLSLSDTEGGSFSVTSLGRIGGTGFTPIIKAPEVAILGVSRLRERVVAINGKPHVRPMLPLSLSYDHRAIDGAMAARFMTHLREQLEQPEKLLQ